jgi:hypothetical protein
LLHASRTGARPSAPASKTPERRTSRRLRFLRTYSQGVIVSNGGVGRSESGDTIPPSAGRRGAAFGRLRGPSDGQSYGGSSIPVNRRQKTAHCRGLLRSRRASGARQTETWPFFLLHVGCGGPGSTPWIPL